MALVEFEPSMYIKTAAASECHIEVWEGVAQPWERLYDISSAITSKPKFIFRNYLHTTTAAAAAVVAAVVAAYDCESGCELEQQWQLLWAHYNIINPQIWLIDSLTLQPHLNSTQHNRIGKCTFHLSLPQKVFNSTHSVWDSGILQRILPEFLGKGCTTYRGR